LRSAKPIKRTFRRLLISFVQDDLFVRVACFLAGLLLGSLGVAISIWAATHHASPSFQSFCWIIAIPFTVWGALLILRCAVSLRSRMARFIDKYLLPDTPNLEDAALLLLTVYAPAVLLTLLLRFLGVSGQRPLTLYDQLPRRPDAR
jgi:cytochrome c biogenesis protein CcdA